MLLQVNVPNVAFFVLRHMLELVLKRIIDEVTGTAAWGHDVKKLLGKLPADDPLRTSESEPETSIRAMIEMVDALDRKGDAARYAFNGSGEPSFADDVCVQRSMLSEAAEMLWDYTLARAGGYHGVSERPEKLDLGYDVDIDGWW
jgi:hypothetical protein